MGLKTDATWGQRLQRKEFILFVLFCIELLISIKIKSKMPVFALFLRILQVFFIFQNISIQFWLGKFRVPYFRNIPLTCNFNFEILPWLHHIWFDEERTQIEWCMMWINSDWVLLFICFRSSEIWILIESADDSEFVMPFVFCSVSLSFIHRAKGAIRTAADWPPGAFYTELNRKIFKTTRSCHGACVPIVVYL